MNPEPKIIEAEPVEHPVTPKSVNIDRITKAGDIASDCEKVIEGLGSSLTISERDLQVADNTYNEDSERALNADLIEALQPVFAEYKNKYGVDLKYDTLQTFINFANFASKSDQEIKEVINSKLITDACDFVIFKGILVAAKVIDSQLNAIQNKDFTDKVSLEALSVATSIFDWIEKLESIKKKYKQYNLDTKINKYEGVVNYVFIYFIW